MNKKRKDRSREIIVFSILLIVFLLFIGGNIGWQNAGEAVRKVFDASAFSGATDRQVIKPEQQPVETETCTDSDGYNNVLVSGYVMYEGEKYGDYCEESIVYDYSCPLKETKSFSIGNIIRSIGNIVLGDNQPPKTSKDCTGFGEDYVCEDGACVLGLFGIGVGDDGGEETTEFEEGEGVELLQYVPGEIIVKFTKESGIDSVSKIDSYLRQPQSASLSSTNVNKMERVIKEDVIDNSHGLNNLFTFYVDSSLDIEEIIAEYELDPSIEYAEPNYLYYTSLTPNDEFYNNQWPLKNTGQDYYAPIKQAGSFFQKEAGSQNWEERTNDLPNLFLSEVEFDPEDENILYIGAASFRSDGNTGHIYNQGFHPDAGLYISTDKGITWALFALEGISVLDIEFATNNIIYAATNDKIYKSSDKGLTWEKLKNFDVPINHVFSIIKVDPNNPNVLYTVGDMGSYNKQFLYLYKTTNAGLSWNFLFSNIVSGGGIIMDIEINPINSHLYLAGGDVLEANGSKWDRRIISEGITTTYNGERHIYDIEIDKNNPDILYAGGWYGLYKTTNGGELWVRDEEFGYKTVSSIKKQGEELYVGISRLNYDNYLTNIYTPCSRNPTLLSEDSSLWKKVNGEWGLVSDGLTYNTIVRGIRFDSNGNSYLSLDMSLADKIIFKQGNSGSDTNVESVWDLETLSEPIIAVIDTGVDYNHPDLIDNMLADCNGGCPEGTGYDFVDLDVENEYEYYCYFSVEGEDYPDEDNDPFDVHGHGTHCAGIISATQNNGFGVSGICPNCKIMPIRAGFTVYNYAACGGLCGSLELTDIVQGIRYAADNGADVISMSFGGPDSYSEEDAVNYAYDKSVVLVAAAGNGNTESYSYPAAYSNVVAVAATDANDQRASFSNFGAWVDVAAPGKDILSLRAAGSDMYQTQDRTVNENYYVASGTSMATPYVAGLAGLLLSKNPSLTNDQVRAKIINGVDLIETDKEIGGRINAEKAISAYDILEETKISSPSEASVFRRGDLIEIKGSVPELDFSHYQIWYGLGSDPLEWFTSTIFLENNGNAVIKDGTLALWNTSQITENDFYSLKLVVHRRDGSTKEFIVNRIYLDSSIMKGWPKKLGVGPDDHGGVQSLLSFLDQPTIVDVDNNGKKDIVVAYHDEINVFDYLGNSLPGWPINIVMQEGDTIQRGAVVADLDKDGYMEIVAVDNDGYVHLLNHDGTYVVEPIRITSEYAVTPIIEDIDGDGNLDIFISRLNRFSFYNLLLEQISDKWDKYLPPLEGYSYVNYIRDSPVVGDLNNDGCKELVIKASPFQMNPPEDFSTIWVFDCEGNLLEGWPKNIFEGGAPYSNLVLADLDNDNFLDIITSSKSGKIYAWDFYGNNIEGWPVQGAVSYELSIGDINGDGNLEIILTGSLDDDSFCLFIYNNQGIILKGYPVCENLGHPTIFQGIPLIVNIDSDPEMEIIPKGGYNFGGIGVVFAFNYDGSIVSNFPKYVEDSSHGNIFAAGDLDGDGNTELVLHTWGDYLFAYDLPGESNKNAWPQFQHDAQHTGCYDCDKEQETEITCSPGQIIGDINADGTITVGDVGLLTGILNGEFTYPADICCIDINQDGLISDLDATELGDIIGGMAKSPGRCGDCGDVSHGECTSSREYCFNGQLINNCNVCGCPSGATCKSNVCEYDPVTPGTNKGVVKDKPVSIGEGGNGEIGGSVEEDQPNTLLGSILGAVRRAFGFS